jgi:FlaA1/EpsC-like NDP-sugar epimerase
MAAVAWQATWWIRFNLDIPLYYWQLSLYVMPIILLIQGLVSWRFGLYRGLWRFASLPDLWNIFRAAVLGALCITIVLFIWNRLEGIPRAILILYPILLIFLLGGPRLAYRLWKDRSLNLKVAPDGQKVLIIGAGSAGEMLVREMLRDGNYIPVGFVDDNPLLKNSEVHGVRVLGTVEDLSQISRLRKIDLIVIAVPAATDEQMQRIVSKCEESTIPLRTLPKIQDMMSGKVTLAELHEVSIEDLLGRDRVELDWQIIRQGLTNKVVMVSGGGGSIGSELCAQISSLNPSVLVIFERNEFNLYNVQRSLLDTRSSLKIHAILGDLCDKAKVDHVLAVHKPDVIFHAAAYKHVPLLQNQSREAVRNNILGTKNLAESAIVHGCSKFVFISTDKAVNPANVLGASKRIAEMYCEWMNQRAKTRFITVRFGNVLGSDGSVVPLFREQIKKGGPVTVTHPDISRFFMTIREACQLILQAGAMGKGGEIYVLDMGDPVKIAYLAEQMIRLSGFVPGQDIMITYIGLRPGEKLFEELFYDSEGKQITEHPKILLARHSGIDWTFLKNKIEELEQACSVFDEARLKVLLDLLAPASGYQLPQQDNVVPLKQA